MIDLNLRSQQVCTWIEFNIHCTIFGSKKLLLHNGSKPLHLSGTVCKKGTWFFMWPILSANFTMNDLMFFPRISFKFLFMPISNIHQDNFHALIWRSFWLFFIDDFSAFILNISGRWPTRQSSQRIGHSLHNVSLWLSISVRF